MYSSLQIRLDLEKYICFCSTVTSNIIAFAQFMRVTQKSRILAAGILRSNGRASLSYLQTVLADSTSCAILTNLFR
jgi:hypothetical protein